MVLMTGGTRIFLWEERKRGVLTGRLCTTEPRFPWRSTRSGIILLEGGDVEQFAQVKQPAYINGNVYLKGAPRFDREEMYYEDASEPEVKITREGREVYLEIVLPEESLEMPTEVITTEKLGMVRIVEQRYEAPDGSALRLGEDMAGNKRGERPLPGPLEGLHAGRNKVKIWTDGNTAPERTTSADCTGIDAM